MRKATNKRLFACIMAGMLATEAILPVENGVFKMGVEETYAQTMEDWEYEILKDGTVSVTGYNGSEKEIVIPEKIDDKSVTEIGEFAFLNCRDLTSIEIPSSVTSIGDEAFSGCEGLTSIEIPENVVSIGYSVFSECSGIQSIVVDENNTIYDSRENCNAIIKTSSNELIAGCKNTKIPDSVISIGICAFAFCEGLTGIEIPSSVKSIGEGAFDSCSGLTSIKIPEGITELRDWVFNGCEGLTSIEIPDSVKLIGNAAFRRCSALTSIEIPEDVTSIGFETFSECRSLVNIEIPSSVTSIGLGAFRDCKGLTSIEIPDGVTSIGDMAFRGCENLASIEIPDGVTSIGKDAFYECDNLVIYSSWDAFAYIYASYNNILWKNIERKKVELQDQSILLEKTICIYDGIEKKPVVMVKSGNKLLVEGINYNVDYTNNVNVGKATVTVTGIGRYKGTVTKTFTIEALEIADVTLENDNYVYDGKVKEPSVTVTAGDKVLVVGEDYIVSYIDNVKAGTATVTVTGKGNYAGTVTKTFIIEESPKPIVKPVQKPSVVKSLKQNTSYSTVSATLTWDTVSGATGYEVYRATSKNGKYTRVATVTKTTYKNSKLKAGNTYYYKVRAYKTDNKTNVYGDYSSVITAITKTVAPSVTVKARKKKATVTWKKVTGADGYEVYMSTSKKGTYKKLKAMNKKTVSYTKSKLTKGKKYYFKVRTYRTVSGKKVYSSWSTVKNVKIK